MIIIQDDRESELSDLNSTLFQDDDPFKTLPIPTPPPRPSSAPPTIKDTKCRTKARDLGIATMEHHSRQHRKQLSILYVNS